jgi:hypothetical protein
MRLFIVFYQQFLLKEGMRETGAVRREARNVRRETLIVRLENCETSGRREGRERESGERDRESGPQYVYDSPDHSSDNSPAL